MHILIAPNAFKNSLNANDAARAIEQGLQLSKLTCTTACFPIADGGDGTGSLIIEKCGGRIVERRVQDPLGREIRSSFGLIENERTAVIEMADASGLRLLEQDKLNPLKASSYGTGQLIRFALDEGVKKIIIAMGGSATVDGGCGILNALGISFLDKNGKLLPANPQALTDLARIDASAVDERVLHCEVVILCDVDNELLGPQGAAHVFGPQKGATPGDVVVLDDFLKNFAAVTSRQTGIDIAGIRHSGTAGGAAAGLHAWINARLVNGIDHFLSLTGFGDALKNCDLLITGEGSIDRQTLQGKGPYGVAVKAKEADIPVIGLAGKIPLTEDKALNKYFDVLISINNEPGDVAAAMKNTRENLTRTAKTIGDLLALKQ